jgi:pSer/pThr/pTyr-binding forkhead associated (FHA) protein
MTVLIARRMGVELLRRRIDRPILTIGRGRNNDVAVKDKSLSRSHARLERHAEGYRVRDLGSANGIKVNGARVTGAMPIDPGDEVLLGQVVFFLDDDGAPDPAAAVERKGVTPVLTVTNDDGQRSSFAILSEEIVLGRADDADVSLPSKKISRRHAKLRRAGGFFVLADLGSQNGTWVRNKRVDKPARLTPGDGFYIEPYTILLEERELEIPGEDDAPPDSPARTAFFLSPDELQGLTPNLRSTGQIDAPDESVFGDDEDEDENDTAQAVASPAPEISEPRKAAPPRKDAGRVRVTLLSGRVLEHEMRETVATLGDSPDCDLRLEAGDFPVGPSLVLIAAEGGRLAIVHLGHGPLPVVDGLEHETALLEPGDTAVLGPLEISWEA